MGLDVTAFTKLTPAPEVVVEDGYAMEENCWHAGAETIKWTEDNWPGRTAGIESGATYRASDTFGFSAGSYGGYNRWREQLAQLAGFISPRSVWDKETKEGPFVEQINFADNEGVIGPIVAAKLAKDYREFYDRALAIRADREWFVTKYHEWMRAFELAADGGAVEFH